MGLEAGSTLGPYEILSFIAAGGMGEVYRARDPRLGRDVAIKVLPADRVGDADRRRRFIHEAHAASALNHPHIVTIHEIESANGMDFIVMEYVRGKSLDQLIVRRGMRMSELLRIAIAVADALAAAHARGIVHRDLKPSDKSQPASNTRPSESASRASTTYRAMRGLTRHSRSPMWKAAELAASGPSRCMKTTPTRLRWGFPFRLTAWRFSI